MVLVFVSHIGEKCTVWELTIVGFHRDGPVVSYYSTFAAIVMSLSCPVLVRGSEQHMVEHD